jgi:hypothetical protein
VWTGFSWLRIECSHRKMFTVETVDLKGNSVLGLCTYLYYNICLRKLIHFDFSYMKSTGKGFVDRYGQKLN